MRAIRNIMPHMPIIIGSVAFGVTGQLILKKGADRLDPIDVSLSGFTGLFAQIGQEPLLLLGVPFFILGAVLWLVVLSRLDLSYAYPFLGVHYLLITLAAWLVLGESVGAGRWLAVMIIVAGILVVGHSEVAKNPHKGDVK